MTLDAATPEKLRDAFVESLRETRDKFKKGKEVWLAFAYFSDYIANATLVAPKTREVWAVVDTFGDISHVELNQLEAEEWLERFSQSRVVRATLTLDEEV